MRFIGSMLRAATGPRLRFDTPLVSHHRVWPSDMNLGMHMDNVRYLQLMDRARNEFFLRTGIAWFGARRRMAVPVASCEVIYRRPLLAWERFSLHTQLLGWDDKRFYLEQRFLRDDREVTRGRFRCAFSTARGVRPPGEIFSELLGETAVSPELPAGIRG